MNQEATTPISHDKETQIALDEFRRDRDLWTQLLLTRLSYREQQLDKLTDRQREHILQFSGLALAAAAIVGPFVLTSDSPAYPVALFAVLLLFVNALIGTLLTVLLLNTDRNEVRKVLHDEQELLSIAQRKTVEILNKLLDGQLPYTEIAEYYALKEKSQKKFSADAPKPSTLVNGLYYLLLISFFAGIVALLLSVPLGNEHLLRWLSILRRI